MSARDYPTRLYWAGFRGVARMHGAEVRLSAAPCICGRPVDGVDYIPHDLAQIMPRGERWRDMDPAERAAAERLLDQAMASVVAL